MKHSKVVTKREQHELIERLESIPEAAANIHEVEDCIAGLRGDDPAAWRAAAYSLLAEVEAEAE